MVEWLTTAKSYFIDHRSDRQLPDAPWQDVLRSKPAPEDIETVNRHVCERLSTGSLSYQGLHTKLHNIGSKNGNTFRSEEQAVHPYVDARRLDELLRIGRKRLGKKRVVNLSGSLPVNARQGFMYSFGRIEEISAAAMSKPKRDRWSTLEDLFRHIDGVLILILNSRRVDATFQLSTAITVGACAARA